MRTIWTKAATTRLHSEPWRKMVEQCCFAGFGVEDIALWMDCHPSHIRAEFAQLREDGVFQKWWGKSVA